MVREGKSSTRCLSSIIAQILTPQKPTATAQKNGVESNTREDDLPSCIL